MRRAIVWVSIVFVAAVSSSRLQASSPQQRGAAATPSPGERIEVPPPPFTEGIFPCSGCHNKDMPPNRTRRPLAAMHDDIVLKHDEEHRWCLVCHDAENRDQ